MVHNVREAIAGLKQQLAELLEVGGELAYSKESQDRARLLLQGVSMAVAGICEVHASPGWMVGCIGIKQ